MNEQNLALTIANLALDKQAQEPELIKVSDLVDYADYIMVCGGRSERQVRAIAESIEQGLKAQDIRPLGVEGVAQGHWVLMDYGTVIVHIFHESSRAYYDIENMWMDAQRVEIETPEVSVTPEIPRGRCASGS